MEAGPQRVWGPSIAESFGPQGMEAERCRTSYLPRVSREADWDKYRAGLALPLALAVPGAIVEALYVEGNRIDYARYEVLQEQIPVRWMPADQQPATGVPRLIRLTEILTFSTETLIAGKN